MLNVTIVKTNRTDLEESQKFSEKMEFDTKSGRIGKKCRRLFPSVWNSMCKGTVAKAQGCE